MTFEIEGSRLIHSSQGEQSTADRYDSDEKEDVVFISRMAVPLEI